MLKEFLTILGVNYLGFLLEKILHLPIPGTVNGLLILFLLLILKIIKLDSIKMTGEFLVANMVITFIPPSIKLLDILDTLKADFFKLIFLLVATTLITMVVTALSVDFLMKRGEKND